MKYNDRDGQSLELDDLLERAVVGLRILDDFGVDDLPVFHKLLGQKGPHDVVVADNGDPLVFLIILHQNILQLVNPRPQFSSSLIYNFILQKCQQSLLFFLVASPNIIFLDMAVPFLMVMRLQMLYKPNFLGILHMAEIEGGKLFFLLLQVVAYITGVSEDLGDDGVHFHWNISSAEYVLAGL